MKDSTKSAVAGITYALVLTVLCWILFIIPYELGSDLALFLPLIPGLIGIPVYFILRNHFDASIYRFCTGCFITNFLVSFAIYLICMIIKCDDSWAFLGYSLVFLLITVSVYTPLILDLLFTIGKAIWKWLGKRFAL